MVTAIYIADSICCQNQIGFYLTAQSQEVTEDALAVLGLDAAKVGAVLEELPDRIVETEQIFSDSD